MTDAATGLLDARSETMTNTPDMSKMMQDMMAAFPMDATAMNDTFKTQAALGEKMSKVVLEAADKSTEISAKWAKEMYSKLGEVAKMKEEPSEYSKAMTDYASAQAEMTAE